MPDELRIVAAAVLAAGGAFVAVPLAIRLAGRTGFYDIPVGYKGHERPTPYLGGLGVIAAFAMAAVLLGGGAWRFEVVVLCALAFLAVGTLDDRRGLGPGIRLAVEAAAAVALFAAGAGWSIFASDSMNLLLTVVWVVGIVNAFNLMDNMDGATGTVAAVSASGVAAVALAAGDPVLAALLLALAGACAGFLPYNLARPSRVFLGDGGSMPVGLVIAAGVMALPFEEGLAGLAVLAAAPLVGLPILDTTLVVISRARRGVQILSGGRDHLTHRLRSRLGSPGRVAAALALAQAALCLVAVALAEAGSTAVLASAFAYVMAGAGAIYMLEAPMGSRAVPLTLPEESSA